MRASTKLKFILFVDAILFLLCIGGIISISEKAKLPFDIISNDSTFVIKINPENSYGLKTGDKLLAVDGFKITLSDKPEFITDRKNINDNINITVRQGSIEKTVVVKLINFYSSFYLISTSIVSLFFFIVALFVLIKKPELKAAHLFHWASISIVLMMCLTWSNPYAFSSLFGMLFRIPFNIAYVLAPPLFAHFTLVFPRDNTHKWKWFLIVNYSTAIVLAIIVNYKFIYTLYYFTDDSINNYLTVFNVVRIFLILEVIISLSFFISAFRREKGIVERKQLKWLLLGFIVGPFCFIMFWVIPILLTGNPVVPEEIVMIILCIIPISFAISIIKYHLLNIDEVINRSIVYVIVLSILLLIYSALIVLSVYILDLPDQSLISAFSAVILALLFQPLKTVTQSFVDKKFFRIRYNFRRELNKLSDDIKNYNDIAILEKYLIREIERLIPVDKIAFSEFDNQTGKLSIKSQINFDQIKNKILRIKPETLERRWFQVASVKGKVESGVDISTLYQNTLLRWNIGLVVPIKSVKDDLFGFIILGQKKSGAKFSIEDVDLLKNIALNTGTTIERIKLQEQLILEKLAAEKLEELNQQKSMFVSTVSHDLKTPLTSIKIFAEMLLQNEKLISDKSKQHLEIIEGESDRLTRLINNILDFSKIEKDVKEYFLREVHLNKIVSNVIDLMYYTLKMNDFKITINTPDFKDCIVADTDAITEAIENLISNAIRFSNNNKEIIVSTFPKDNFVCVSVRDYGIGIDQSDFEKIYNPFFRSDIAKQKKIDGTGLGLPIVKHIVEKHKGKILLESSPGQGSTFTLCFPVKLFNKGDNNEANINN